MNTTAAADVATTDTPVDSVDSVTDRPDTPPVDSDTDDRGVTPERAATARTELVGYPAPAPEFRAPVYSDPVADKVSLADGPPMIWAVSAHGGAGAEALASRVGFVADAGHGFPSGTYPGEDYVVICAEETVTGLRRGLRLVLQHMNGLGGDTVLLGVVTRPVNPAWTGKKTPKPIWERLGLFDDPNLGCPVFRLGWDDDLAVTFADADDAADRRTTLTPAEVAEWLAADDRDRKKARKVRGSLAASGVTDTASQLLERLLESRNPTPEGEDPD